MNLPDQNNERNMKIFQPTKPKICEACRGDGYIFVKPEQLDKEEHKDILEHIISVYGINNIYRAGWQTIPCPACKGSNNALVNSFTNASLNRSNIPKIYSQKYINDFDRTIYKDNNNMPLDISKIMLLVDEFIKNYASNSKNDLYIYSSKKGTGKTFLACCICNTIIKNHPTKNIFFVSESTILECSKADNNASITMQNLCTCDLLCIDDIGQKLEIFRNNKNGNGWLNSVLFEIINKRYEQKLATIYTSNIQLKNLEYEDRIVDRMYSRSIPISLPEYPVRTIVSTIEKQLMFKELF